MPPAASSVVSVRQPENVAEPEVEKQLLSHLAIGGFETTVVESSIASSSALAGRWQLRLIA
jgi:hypothetical protein